MDDDVSPSYTSQSLGDYMTQQRIPAAQIDFDKKTKFYAHKEITKRRSANHQPPTRVKTVGIWDVKPPDFNPQAFSAKPPERNSREAMRPWTYAGPEEHKPRIKAANRKQDRRREEELIALVREASSVQLPPSEMQLRPRFHLRFPPVHKHQHRTLQDKFEDIKPHDYRQYPDIKRLGLPEFTTSYPRDPMSLRFKTQRIDTLHGEKHNFFTNPTGTMLYNYSHDQRSWEKRLILPKEAFPNKSRAFTRHRRMDRSARSAFLERAEEMMRSRKIEVL